MSKKTARLRKQSTESDATKSPHEARNAPAARGERKPDQSPTVWQRDKLAWPLSIRERPDFTSRQHEIIDLILDKGTKVLFLNGPAGSSKTYMGVYCGLHLLTARRVSNLVYVRTVVESASKSLGYLPGDLGGKMEPFLMPLMDKVEELIPAPEGKRLLAEKRISGIPVGHLRGASMNAQCILVDECQNLTKGEMVTVLTRLGQYSKIILMGDAGQADIGKASGFMSLFDLFNDQASRDQGIFCESLTKADIVRSATCRYIVERLEGLK